MGRARAGRTRVGRGLRQGTGGVDEVEVTGRGVAGEEIEAERVALDLAIWGRRGGVGRVTGRNKSSVSRGAPCPRAPLLT